MADIEDIIIESPNVRANIEIAKKFIDDLLLLGPQAYSDNKHLDSAISKIRRKYRQNVGKRWLSHAYKELSDANPIKYPKNHALRYAVMKNAIRSASGIVNVTVVMPPDRFSCKYNCKFCPNEPGMPRSYLSNEDAVQRAASVDFETVRQVHVRFRALELNGHPLDKIEFRILGGTFSCYSHDIADQFIRDLYYAANIWNSSSELERAPGTLEQEPGTVRAPGTLEQEQEFNTKAAIHVVGLGVETRPDEIDEQEIVRFRRYGVTRVELGVQHTNDDLLRLMSRGHLVAHSKKAIGLLKEYGFKIEIHIMTDLPNSSPELDKECYRLVLKDDPDLIPDYMKDYPCLDVDFTEIKKWKQDGRWKPYAELDGGRHLRDVLIYRQQITPKWVRVNRIQRDFRPACDSRLGFTSETLTSDLGNRVTREAEEQGIFCQCIRCSEVRNQSYNINEIQYNIHQFLASGAPEYFICASVPRPNRDLLIGFIRLRLCHWNQEAAFVALKDGTAMIRELHVYGQVNVVGDGQIKGAQHRGIGRQLLAIAENIAAKAHYEKIAIIAGVGVRDYYKKFGYTLEDTYMIKSIEKRFDECKVIIITLLFVFITILVILKVL
jgi:ELP3 family radical SAM enzyme/protein acetyltransferase